VDYVIVNGTLAYRGGEQEVTRNGRFLRRAAS